MSNRSILILQGPNLDLLGVREPERYGRVRYADLAGQLDVLAAELGVTLRQVQSAHEGSLVDTVHEAWRDGIAGAVVNAAAYTHTSIALRDALLATSLPFVEVHLTNVYARESFRHRSYLSDIARGTVTGLGVDGYAVALRALVSGLALGEAGVWASGAHEPSGSPGGSGRG